MTGVNTGIAYELFVQRVQQAVIEAQGIGGYKNINVQHNVKLIDKNGLPRQFDLYWEFEFGGVVYRNVIECKDFASSVPIDKIDALAGKLTSFPGLHGVIATPGAFQSGAIRQAEAKGIDLMVVRSDSDEDWRSPEGVPYIRKIAVTLEGTIPPQVFRFDPTFDSAWAKANGITRIHIKCLPAECQFMEDAGGVWTIQDDMDQGLGELENGTDIKMFKRKCPRTTFCKTPTTPKMKILGYELAYRVSSKFENVIEISPEVFGVVEYVSRKRKKVVMKLGEEIIIRDEEILSSDGHEAVAE